MDSQFTAILLDNLKGLLLGIQEEIAREEESRDIEELNETLGKINDASTEDEKQNLKNKRDTIQSRILDRNIRRKDKRLAQSLTPEARETLGGRLDEVMKDLK